MPSEALLAAVIWVQTDREILRGELLEAVRDDYLLVQTSDGAKHLIPWSSIRHLRAPERGEVAADEIELPWAVRPTVGARFGASTVGSEYFNPYISMGGMIAVDAGISLTRSTAITAAYEWTGHPTDERNPGARRGRSDFFGLSLRLRTNAASGAAGFLFEPTIGVRTLAYGFSATDGDADPELWELPSGPMTERARLTGYEVRLPIGFSVTLSRSFSLDHFIAPGIGQFIHYSDTLGCATFRLGKCGGGYSFGFSSFSLGAALRWN